MSQKMLWSMCIEAKITDLAGFVNNQKNPSKSVAAFDDLNRSQAENNVFGNDESDGCEKVNDYLDRITGNTGRQANMLVCLYCILQPSISVKSGGL